MSIPAKILSPINVGNSATTSSTTYDSVHQWYYIDQQASNKTRSKKTPTETTTTTTTPPPPQATRGHMTTLDHVEYFFKANIRNEFGIGLIKIVWHPRTAVKLFWLVFLLGSLTITSYLIISNLIYYLEYDVITKVRNFYETPAQFPEVIVCNQNMITTEYGYNVSRADPLYWANVGGLPQSDKSLLGHSLADILLSCRFNGIECNSSDFYPFFDRQMGNCYAFNAGKNSLGKTANKVLAMRAGSDYGLQLTWYTNYYELLNNVSNGSPGLGNSQKLSLINYNNFGTKQFGISILFFFSKI